MIKTLLRRVLYALECRLCPATHLKRNLAIHDEFNEWNYFHNTDCLDAFDETDYLDLD